MIINKFNLFMNYKNNAIEDYYEVIVFSNHVAMYNYYLNTGGRCDLTFEAVCRDLEFYDFKDNEKDVNKVGEILIPISNYKNNIIIHECGHAVFQYMRKISKENMWNINNNNCWNGEEFYCELLESVTKQFTLNLDNVKKAFAIANNAIYFDDSSDYVSALYQICMALNPTIEEDKIGIEFIEE